MATITASAGLAPASRVQMGVGARGAAAHRDPLLHSKKESTIRSAQEGTGGGKQPASAKPQDSSATGSNTPQPGCENDIEDRFTAEPGGDSQSDGHVSDCAATSCGYATRPATAKRDARSGTGATPPVDAPVVAWVRACFHTPWPGRGRSHPWIPAGRQADRCPMHREQHESLHCGAVQYALTALGFEQAAGTTSRCLPEV